jgi:ABC-2 type transport system permease protein
VNDLAGTATLVRLALRRSRVLIAVWVVGFVAMAAYSAAATIDLYPTLTSRVDAAETLNGSQAMVALYGRVHDPSSIGGLSIIKLGGIGAVFVSLLAVSLVVRHTRQDEEAGRTELLGATVVGRRAPLGAALLVVGLVNVVLGALTAVALTAVGLPGQGSVAFGAALAGVGIAFGAIAAVTAQLTTSARTASALAAGVLAVVYVLRAVGDLAQEGALRWLSWLSPVGWGQQFRPYAGNRWWVLLVVVGFTVVTVSVAFALATRRDLGTGLVPVRDGPATASPGLRTPLALAWRLQRVALFGWAVGFAVLGGLVGSMASEVGGFTESETAQEFITKLGGLDDLIDAFLALELGMAGVVAAAYGIHAVLRLRAEEVELRAEPVLATGVSRLRWAGGHLVVALAGTTTLLLVVGTSAGAAHGIAVGDAGAGGAVFLGALAQLPAAWVLVTLTAAAYGAAPHLAALGWVVLAVFLVIGEFGPLLGLSQWLMDLSPFVHMPRLPGGPVDPLPLVVAVAAALGLAALGLVGLRRRDIT